MTPGDQLEEGKTTCESLPLPWRTPDGHLGVIYDSQPAEIDKNATTNRWKLFLFFLEKSA
jgi:hypothetical protein